MNNYFLPTSLFLLSTACAAPEQVRQTVSDYSQDIAEFVIDNSHSEDISSNQTYFGPVNLTGSGFELDMYVTSTSALNTIRPGIPFDELLIAVRYPLPMDPELPINELGALRDTYLNGYNHFNTSVCDKEIFTTREFIKTPDGDLTSEHVLTERDLCDEDVVAQSNEDALPHLEWLADRLGI